MPDQPSNQPNPTQPVLYFHYAGLTNTGMIRDHNEDAYKLPLDNEAGTLAAKGYLYVLADGMGGHKKGEIASAITIETVNSVYYAEVTSLEPQNQEEAIVKALSNAIAEANNQVMSATEGGGTTVVAVVLHSDFIVTMNVGDSRAYLLRDSQLQLLSRDHSLVRRLVEMGKITAEEALTHPRRNVLYQALGQGLDVEIHIYSQKLQLNDVIILCSDGLWGEVGEPTLKEVLSQSTSPLSAVKQLIDLANASGGADNITAIVIYVSDQAPSEDELALVREYSSSPATVTTDDTKPALPSLPPKPQSLPE